MDIQSIFLIVSCAISAAGIIATIITTLSKIKSNKDVKLAQILQALPDAIKDAETVFGNGNGAAKLIYVLTKVNIACVNLGIQYDEEVWKNMVEKILETPSKK